QMAPTQAYLKHNGLVTALPEPVAWQALAGRPALSLVRTPEDAEQDEASQEGLLTQNSELRTQSSPALGSGPGIEADVMFRRVGPGWRVERRSQCAPGRRGSHERCGQARVAGPAPGGSSKAA